MARIFKTFILISSTAILATPMAFAQVLPSDTPLGQPIEITNPIAPPVKKSRLVRKVEPVPYWVDADQLSVRDNPVAGDVVAMLELGQKVKAYARFEDWVRISKSSQPEKWIKVNFLTSKRVTWADYNNGSRRRSMGNASRAADDVHLKRIKVEGDKGQRVYAASLKQTLNGNRIIVTRQNFRTGTHFEKRLVACDSNGQASHVQFLGEGYNYMMMEKDVRADMVDVNNDIPRKAITSENISDTTRAIVNFACEKLS